MIPHWLDITWVNEVCGEGESYMIPYGSEDNIWINEVWVMVKAIHTWFVFQGVLIENELTEIQPNHWTLMKPHTVAWTKYIFFKCHTDLLDVEQLSEAWLLTLIYKSLINKYSQMTKTHKQKWYRSKGQNWPVWLKYIYIIRKYESN